MSHWIWPKPAGYIGINSLVSAMLDERLGLREGPRGSGRRSRPWTQSQGTLAPNAVAGPQWGKGGAAAANMGAMDGWRHWQSHGAPRLHWVWNYITELTNILWLTDLSLRIKTPTAIFSPSNETQKKTDLSLLANRTPPNLCKFSARSKISPIS